MLSLTYVTQRNVTNNKEKLEVSPIFIEKWGPKEKTWSSFPYIPRGITRVLMERKKTWNIDQRGQGLTLYPSFTGYMHLDW